MMSVSNAFCAVLDQLNAGVVVVHTSGKVLHANRAASEMFAKGWPIRITNGYIQTEDRKTTAILLKALQHVTEEVGILPPDKSLAGHRPFAFVVSERRCGGFVKADPP